jgi:hypothetical protein
MIVRTTVETKILVFTFSQKLFTKMYENYEKQIRENISENYQLNFSENLHKILTEFREKC